MLVKVYRPTRILAEAGLHVVSDAEAMRLRMLGAAVPVEEEPTVPAEAPQEPAKAAPEAKKPAPKPTKKKTTAKKKTAAH